jgi:hypothetical protein
MIESKKTNCFRSQKTKRWHPYSRNFVSWKLSLLRKFSRKFSFSWKISRNFCFRETFRFCGKFLFPRWFLRKVFVFAKIFVFAHVFANIFVVSKPSAKNEICLGNIHQCFGSENKFSWLLDPDLHSKWKIFAKTLAKTKIFVRFFSRKAKIIFAKIGMKTKIFL